MRQTLSVVARPFTEMGSLVGQQDKQRVGISPSPLLTNPSTGSVSPPAQHGPYSLHSEVISSHPVVINIQEDFVSLHGCTQDLEMKMQERDSGLWLPVAPKGPQRKHLLEAMHLTLFITIPYIGIINQLDGITVGKLMCQLGRAGWAETSL